MAIFTNQGQVCTAGSRLFFLHEKVPRQVLEKVIEPQKKYDSDIIWTQHYNGSVVSAKQKQTVLRYSTPARPTAKPVSGGEYS